MSSSSTEGRNPIKRPRLDSTEPLLPSKQPLPSVSTVLSRDRVNSNIKQQPIGEWGPMALLVACVEVFQDPFWASALNLELTNLRFCQQLFGDKNNPLIQVLQDCSDDLPNNDKQWQRLFEKLLEMYPSKKVEATNGRSQVSDTVIQTTIRAWETKFIGSHHERLFAKLKHVMGPDQYTFERPRWSYRNILPIVQSSGMGKSRTVDELAKLIFTIPICLRKSGDSGFPVGDQQLLSAFTRHETIERDIAPKITCVLILSAIFETIAKELRKSPVRSSLDWYGRLKSTPPLETESVRTRIYDAAYNLFKEKLPATLDHAVLYTAIDEMQCSLVALTNLLPHQEELHNIPLKLVLYVDECQNLTSIVYGERTMLDFVLYAISECREAGLAGITLSTNPTLGEVSYPQDMVASAREYIPSYGVRDAPFVQFGFDEWKGTIITESKLTLFDVCKVEFLARFGRVLWWTRITDPETHEIDAEQIKHLIPFAVSKLVGRNLEEHGQFAVLSVRLCLELEPMRVLARQWEEKLVASHMRIVYNIPEHRHYIRSGYSSEPILAEAAAQIWNNRVAGFEPFDPLSSLTYFSETGILSQSERAKLVARFVLLRARDIAINRKWSSIVLHGRPLNTQACYSVPVLLWDFFEALFNPGQLAKIENARARNRRGGEGLKAACENKYVRFSHFARAGDSSVISTAAGWKGIARANGWQCFERQEHVDILIPVHDDPDGNSPLGRAAITFILVQVNKTKCAKTVPFSAESLGLFDDIPGHWNQLPYFVIVFNFEVSMTLKTSEPSGQPDPPVSPAEPETHRRTNKGGENDSKSGGHPCYWIEVTGWSAMALNSEIVSTGKELRSIIVTSSLQDEVMDLQASDARQRLKPDFAAGDASYNWAKDDPKECGPGTAAVAEGNFDGVVVIEGDDDDNMLG